jgi:hypothetical protein
MPQYNFRVHAGTEVKSFTEVELGRYASWVGLDNAAPGRYSWLFVHAAISSRGG